jgi:hypothetical protein
MGQMATVVDPSGYLGAKVATPNSEPALSAAVLLGVRYG